MKNDLILLKRTFVLSAATVSAAICLASPRVALAQEAPPAATAAVADAPIDYRLDTDDTINIEVVKYNGERFADVSRTIRIPVDGTVRLGRGTTPVTARGKTCDELEAEILERLTREGGLKLRENQVNVSVTGMRMRRVFVRGTASRGGEFELRNGWRVSELVALLGGVSEPQRVKARIVNARRPASVSIDLEKALSAASSEDNIALIEGDTLMLDSPKSYKFYIKGEATQRGEHKIDERFGLRQALVMVGFTTNGATGSMRDAVLLRHEDPTDPSSPVTRSKVDLVALMNDPNAPDVPLKDHDTLEILPSQKFIYVWGEVGGPRKWYLPEDRRTYLVDVMSNAGHTTGSAKIGDIQVLRQTPDGKVTRTSYDFGKFFKGDTKQNPEIQAQDIVFVPTVKRVDPVSTIWQGWGLYGIAQSLIPGLRLR